MRRSIHRIKFILLIILIVAFIVSFSGKQNLQEYQRETALDSFRDSLKALTDTESTVMYLKESKTKLQLLFAGVREYIPECLKIEFPIEYLDELKKIFADG